MSVQYGYDMADETVLVASFIHESNTFVVNPEKTDRSDFQDRREYFGQEVIKHLSGTETGVGGVIDIADTENVNLFPILSASATPGAPVDQDTYEFYKRRIIKGVRENLDDIDGVMLALHGAMVPEHLHDGEGPLISDIRNIVGPDVPISVSLDLHANVTEKMVQASDSLTGFKEYPHLDKKETGKVAMKILLQMIRESASPVIHVERPPQIIYQPRAFTQSGPMKRIMNRAREYQKDDDVLAVNVFVGYYHADIPEMGVSIPVVTDDRPHLAQEISRDLAETLWNRREEFVENYPEPEAAVTEAKEMAAELDETSGPVVIGDFGSNPGGGGASDGTTIPAELLDQDVENAGYAIMYDPDVVEQALDAGVGSSITVTLGGKTDNRHGEPIEKLSAYVKAITDGQYTNKGTSHSGYGVQNNLGSAVHLKCGPTNDLNVIVSSTRESAFDAEVWRHIGIQPERLNVLCIPSFIAFLGDYKPISGGVVLADTPGASAVSPNKFDYDHIPRPLFPLDELQEDAYPTWN